MGGDLLVFRITSFAEFGEDQRAVHAHLEATSRTGNQGETGDALFVFIENRFRQTGGFGEVVSGGAVLDADFFGHGRGPPFRGGIYAIRGPVAPIVAGGTLEFEPGSLTGLIAEWEKWKKFES